MQKWSCNESNRFVNVLSWWNKYVETDYKLYFNNRLYLYLFDIWPILTWSLASFCTIVITVLNAPWIQIRILEKINCVLFCKIIGFITWIACKKYNIDINQSGHIFICFTIFLLSWKHIRFLQVYENLFYLEYWVSYEFTVIN